MPRYRDREGRLQVTSRTRIDRVGASTPSGGGTVTAITGGPGVAATPPTITTTGSLALDIDSLPTSLVIGGSDFIPFLDSPGTTPADAKKITFADFTAGITASPADLDGAVQYNNGGIFGGQSTKFYWDDVNFRLGLLTDTPSQTLDVDDLFLVDTANRQVLVDSTTATGTPGLLVRSDINAGTTNTELWDFQMENSLPISGAAFRLRGLRISEPALPSGPGTQTNLYVEDHTNLTGLASTSAFFVGNTRIGRFLQLGYGVDFTPGPADAEVVSFGSIILDITNQLAFRGFGGITNTVMQVKEFGGQTGDVFRILDTLESVCFFRLTGTGAADGGSNVSIGEFNVVALPDARLHVRGVDTSSALDTLLLENSTPAVAFRVRNDRVVTVPVSLTIGADAAPSGAFTLETFGDAHLSGTLYGGIVAGDELTLGANTTIPAGVHVQEAAASLTRLLLGTGSDPSIPLLAGGFLQFLTTSETAPGATFGAYTAHATAGNTFFGVRAQGNFAAPTETVDTDILLQVFGIGYDTTDTPIFGPVAAGMRLRQHGAAGLGFVPGAVELLVTDVAGNQETFFHLNHHGNVILNNGLVETSTEAVLDAHATDGEPKFFLPPVLSNVGEAAFTTAVDGGLYYNTDLDVLRLYAAGAWTSLTTGGPFQPLDADLTAYAALGTMGYVVRTGAGTVATRTFVAGANIGLTNPDGVAGATTIAVSPQGAGSGLDADTIDGLNSTAFQPVDAGLTALASLGAGIAVSDGADGWFARSIAVTSTATVTLGITNASGVGGNPTLQADVIAGTVAPAIHGFLDSTVHTSTLTGTPVRGDLIVANATPAWARFPRGTAAQFLQMNVGATDPAWITVSSDLTIAAGGVATIANDAVTNAKLRDSAAVSVIGRSSGVAGNPADIIAGTDECLREEAGILIFGQLNTGGIADEAVTLAKLQHINANRLLGRITAGLGDVEELTGANVSTILGSDLTNYLYLPGRAGGQIAYGGTASGDDLTLQSTAHATRGNILINPDLMTVASGAFSLGVMSMSGNIIFGGGGAQNVAALEVGTLNLDLSLANRAEWRIDTDMTFAASLLMNFGPQIKNKSTIAITQGGTWITLNNAPAFTADAAALTVVASRAVNHAPSLSVTGGGTLALTDAIAVRDAPTIGASCTIAFRTGLTFVNRAGAGTQTNAVAVDVADQTVGTLAAAMRSAVAAAAGKWCILSTGTAGSSHRGDFSIGGATLTPLATLHVQEDTAGNEAFRVESVAASDDPNYRLFQASVLTTAVTTTTLFTFTIPASTTVFLEARVVARRTGGASGTAEDAAAYVIYAGVKNVAGTATLVTGSPIQAAVIEDVAGYNATIDVTGATARVRVTGIATTNITWHGTIIVQNVSS